MQEASCQMSLSSDIMGESGNGICLHSRNSSVQGQGEAEMARGAESNLGLSNEGEKIVQFQLYLGEQTHSLTRYRFTDPARFPVAL